MKSPWLVAIGIVGLFVVLPAGVAQGRVCFVIDGAEGTGGPDHYPGNSGDNVWSGLLSTDWAFAGSGIDRICGNEDEDFLFGQLGDDKLEGNGGPDDLFGEEGADFVDGLDGSDYVDGGTRDDSLRGGQVNDVLWGGDGNDDARGQMGMRIGSMASKAMTSSTEDRAATILASAGRDWTPLTAVAKTRILLPCRTCGKKG